MKKNKNNGGLVYSTNPDFVPEDMDEESVETLDKSKQQLRIKLDKKNRAGKMVTLVIGFIGREEDLEILGKVLKNKCGTGGSVKDGEIIIQGDNRQKILQILNQEGYSSKII
jgi:translation initiation factor 1